MRIAVRWLLWLTAFAVLGFVLAWAFLAYLHPDRVMDFATLMQMCGIPIGR